jgi:hypothetical protein
LPSEASGPRTRRTTSWFLLAVAVATALWLVEFLPSNAGRLPRTLAGDLGWVHVVGSVVALVALWLAVTAAMAARRRELPDAPTKQPLLKPLRLPRCRARRPVVTITGLEPGAGATTLTFNLGVLLARSGELRDEEGAVGSVRPLCVLAEGPLTSLLGLSPGPLEELVENPYRLMPRLLELAVHHPSGCELLCLAAREDASRRLVTMIDQLRHHYDAVLVDGAFGLDPVLDITAEFGELLLLVGRPTPTSAQPAADWADRVWAMRLEGKSVLLVNRAGSGQAAPDMTAGFIHVAQLPDDSAIADFDRLALPWSLDARLQAARQLTRMAAQMFPTLMVEAGTDAA